MSSLKKQIRKLLNKLLDKFMEYTSYNSPSLGDAIGEELDKEFGDHAHAPASLPVPSLASCWDGPNAQKRMMNLASPKMSDAKATEYIDWMIGRGCNTAHIFVTNQGDGEYAGYDGRKADDAKTISRRISMCRDAGLYVVPWLMADDSSKLNAELLGDPLKTAEKLMPFLTGCDLVVLGLEMDEYGSMDKFKALRDALKTKGYKGEFGTHHTSGKYPFASLGKFVFDQLDPKSATADSVKKSVKSLSGKGYKVIGFEYSRNPSKTLAQSALDAGAVGVGNMDKGVKTSSTSTSSSSSSGIAPVEESVPLCGSDETAFGELEFDAGGFNGSRAQIVDDAVIGNLKVSSKIAYKWIKGGCEKLGATSKTDADHTVACLFCQVGGQWHGGKFDWISTSRDTRDTKNIETGYNGWKKEWMDKASQFAFVIIDAKGTRRTNVITCGGK